MEILFFEKKKLLIHLLLIQSLNIGEEIEENALSLDAVAAVHLSYRPQATLAAASITHSTWENVALKAFFQKGYYNTC